MAQERILVVGVNRFDGVVENKPIHTAKVLYVVKRKKSADKIGLEQASFNIPYEEFGDWHAPAYYDIEIELAGNGFELIDKKFVGAVDLTNVPIIEDVYNRNAVSFETAPKAEKVEKASK